MAILTDNQVVSVSAISLTEYLEMSLGTASPSQISALEAANLLADAPEYLYNDVLSLCQKNGVFDNAGSSQARQIAEKWNANSINKSPSKVALELADKNVIDVEIIKSNSGDTLTIVSKQTLSSDSSSGGNVGNPSVKTALDAEIDSSGNVKFSPRAGVNKLGEAVQGLATVASAAYCIVGGSIVLGKLIEEGIYHTGKLFGADVTKFDRKLWSHIGSWGDAFGVPLLDSFLTKIDPHEENVVMYFSEDAFLGSVDYLESLGAFSGYEVIDKKSILNIKRDGFTDEIKVFDSIQFGYFTQSEDPDNPGRILVHRVIEAVNTEIFTGKTTIGRIYVESTGYRYYYIFATTDFTELKNNKVYSISSSYNGVPDTDNVLYDSLSEQPKSFTTNGKTVYYVYRWVNDNGPVEDVVPEFDFPSIDTLEKFYSATSENISDIEDLFKRLAWVSIYIEGVQVGGNDNIKNQESANKLTILGPSTKEQRYSLVANKYAHLWSDVVSRGVLQEDGTINHAKFLPIAIPNSSTITSAKVVTGVANKNQTNIAAATQPVLRTISSTVSRVTSQVDTPSNDTGSTPPTVIPIVPPTSLWAVYNPTQSEVDDFGSWLWSSNPIEQVKKIFNDPAQGIIGIHKVFASPSVAGRRDIKVGYISSGVNSNYIGAQYSSVNCGSVKVNEHFGNVFDYMPYTRVQCYLPFIGVVELDSNDVMRGTVSITYGVDVLTGDCLAKISVERDGAGGILYSFPGNCAVRYPFSTGSYMSIVGYGAGALATVATANIGMFGAVGQVFGNRPTIQHGGAFAGNPGATGPKKPYLIITRPQQALARKFNEFEGYPVNTTQVLSDCKGFVRVKEVHLASINATDDELDMIEQILKEGVIVQL